MRPHLCNSLLFTSLWKRSAQQALCCNGLWKGMPGTMRKRRRCFTSSFHPCSGTSRMFCKEILQYPSGSPGMDHAIEITGDGKSLHQKLYPLSPVEQAELDKFLEENISPGRTHPSKSPMAAPFFFIKKKDGSLWPVQDYRLLNSIMVKNKYPLPLSMI